MRPSAWASKFKMMRCRSEVEQHQRANVFHAHVEAPRQQRAHFAAKDQCLRAARRTAIADIFGGQEIFTAFGMSRERELHDIFLDVRRHRDCANHFAHLKDLRTIHHRQHGHRGSLSCAIQNIVQILAPRKRYA